MGHRELLNRLGPFAASLLCAVWALELARMVHEASALRTAGAACLAAFALYAWFRASIHIRALFLAILLGCAASAWIHGSADPLLAGLARALVFGAFFPAVILLRNTVEASPRLDLLRARLDGLDPAATELLTLHGSHGLGSVINVGASAVLAPVVSAGADEGRRTALSATSARGVAIAAMWSPFYLSVAFSSQLVPGVPLWQVVAIGAGCALAGLGISQAMFTPSVGVAALRESLARLRPLALPTAIVVSAVIGATLLLGWSGLHSVAVVIPALCVGYALGLGRGETARVARRTFAGLAQVANELLIVLGGTLLGAVVASLPSVQQLGASVTPEMISGPAVIAALVAVIVLLGQVGLHPMISSSVLVPVICLGNFGICSAVAVAAAVFAWGLNATISIFTIPMAMAASTFGVPVQRLVSRRTLLYALIYAATAVAGLAALNAALRGWGCA